MLQIIRNSSSLTEEELKSIEKRVNRIIEDNISKLPQIIRKTIYISYSGSWYAESSAHIFYWILRQITDTNIYVGSADSFIYHVIAYREENPLYISFTEEGSETIVSRLFHLANLMKFNLVAVTPPLPPNIKQNIPYNVELIELNYPKIHIYSVLLAAKLSINMAKLLTSIKTRSTKIFEEIGDISIVYNELVNQYQDVLEDLVAEVKKYKKLFIFSTPTLYPAAIFKRYYTLLWGADVYLFPLSSLTSKNIEELLDNNTLVLVLASTVEEDLIREVKFKLTVKEIINESLIKTIVIKTDPLTAGIYGVLLSEKYSEILNR